MNFNRKVIIFLLVDFVCLSLLLNILILAEEKFNIFKSSENKNINPDNYSKKYLRHHTHKYLDETPENLDETPENLDETPENLDETQFKMLRKRSNTDEQIDIIDNVCYNFDNKYQVKMLRKSVNLYQQ